jgi:hypothetical protein
MSNLFSLLFLGHSVIEQTISFILFVIIWSLIITSSLSVLVMSDIRFANFAEFWDHRFIDGRFAGVVEFPQCWALSQIEFLISLEMIEREEFQKHQALSEIYVVSINISSSIEMIHRRDSQVQEGTINLHMDSVSTVGHHLQISWKIHWIRICIFLNLRFSFYGLLQSTRR